MVEVFDAWDRGDGDDYAGCFTDDAVVESDGGVARGLAAISDAFAVGCLQEPWRLHFVSNERVVAEPTSARGTWIAFSIATTNGPERATYASLDVSIDATRGRDGWRIAAMATSVRFRCPYHAGWLHERNLELPPVATPPSVRSATQSRPVPRARTDVDLVERARTIAEESEVRRHVARFAFGLDRRNSGEILAEAWRPDGRYDVIDAAGEKWLSAIGQPAIAAAFDAERSDTRTWIRCVTNESVTVDRDAASCQWRELATAVRLEHEPWWIANAYYAELARHAGGWRFVAVRREPLLACRYADGPPPHGPKGAATSP